MLNALQWLCSWSYSDENDRCAWHQGTENFSICTQHGNDARTSTGAILHSYGSVRQSYLPFAILEAVVVLKPYAACAICGPLQSLIWRSTLHDGKQPSTTAFRLR